MKLSITKKQLQFYAWTGLAYLLLHVFSVLINHPEEFFIRSINFTWHIFYITLLNIFLFEYTLKQATLKKVFKFLLLSFAHLMLYSFGLYAWRAIGIGLHIYTPLKSFESVEKAVEFHFPLSVGAIFFFGIIRHIYNYIKLKQAAQLLRIEKQQAELNYLKSQTNPHFLFNTLNNIYSLSRDKSDLAPESILRLSKILRYMLYETGGEYIAIEQELKIIGDYIALETLRYDDSLQVNFKTDIENMKQAIPPLLLIPLVENAFKHGVSETRNQPFVDIFLSVNQRQLKLVVKNSTDLTVEDRTIKENIGLSNLRRQLELLFKDYQLTVQQGDAVFTAILQINLGSHVTN